MKTTTLGIIVILGIAFGDFLFPVWHHDFERVMGLLGSAGLIWARDRGSNSLSDDPDND